MNPCKMSAVTLDDPYLKNAQEKELDYLLSLDEKKLMYYFQKEAGLPTDAESGYAGWEGGIDMNFRGHFLGHFLSALSEMYVSTRTSEARPQLLRKARYIIQTLAACQENLSLKDPENSGYVGPFPISIIPEGGENAYGNTLVPFYDLHKVLQGLIEAFNDLPEQLGELALKVAKGFGTWLSKWVAGRTKAEILGTEFGGMNEALWNLYEITRDDAHKQAASMFDEDELMPNGQNLIRDLAAGKDVLSGRHANTTIPKITGAIRHYEVLAWNHELNDRLSEAERNDLHIYKDAALSFWNLVTDHYSYANGGNSQAEHFWAKEDTVAASFTNHGASGYGDNSTVETCNEFNMLKLTRELFKVTREKKYLDYYEQTFVNAILASQNPETGMTTYFQPQGWGFAKVFGVPTDEFWCCQGTGIENFSKLNDSFFFADGNRIYPAIYRSATLEDTTHNLRIKIAADFPRKEELSAKILVLDPSKESSNAKLCLKMPYWAKYAEAKLTVNGEALALSSALSDTGADKGFIVLDVGAGMEIKLTLPQKICIVPAPDDATIAAIQKGGYLLAACYSSKVDPKDYYYAGILVRMSTLDESISHIVKISKPLSTWGKSVEGNLVTGEETMQRLGDSEEVKIPHYHLANVDDNSEKIDFIPYYLLYKSRYAIYLKYVDGKAQAALVSAGAQSSGLGRHRTSH